MSKKKVKPIKSEVDKDKLIADLLARVDKLESEKIAAAEEAKIKTDIAKELKKDNPVIAPGINIDTHMGKVMDKSGQNVRATVMTPTASQLADYVPKPAPISETLKNSIHQCRRKN